MRSIGMLLLFFFLTGCSSFVSPPRIAVKDVNMIGIDSGGVKMELQLTVTNPNSFAVRLEGYRYDVKILTLPLARGGARDSVSFGPKSTTDVEIPVRLTFGDLREILKRQLQLDAVPYQLSCGVELDTPFGRKAIPLEQEGTFAVPEKYRLSGLLLQMGGLFWEDAK